MTEVWHSLYLRSPEAEKVASTLRDGLTKQGYILYDPFGLIPGAASLYKTERGRSPLCLL